jgi:hypothetical protein
MSNAGPTEPKPVSSPIDTVEQDVVLEPTRGEQGAEVPAPDVEGLDLTLAVEELIRDPNGEVVLFNDSQLRSLALESDTQIVGQGMADEHVTAAGDDVSGYKFISFADGLTLYFDPALDVVVKSGES